MIKPIIAKLLYVGIGGAVVAVPAGYVAYERTRDVPVMPAAAPQPQTATETDVVVQPPPPDVVEVIPVAPGPDFVWVGGCWVFNGRGYVWTRGHWDHPPYPHAVWEPARWHPVHGGFGRREGHWH